MAPGLSSAVFGADTGCRVAQEERIHGSFEFRGSSLCSERWPSELPRLEPKVAAGHTSVTVNLN